MEEIAKTCPRCGIVKSLAGFYNDRSTRDGKSVYCKVCQRSAVDQYHAANRDIILERQRLRNAIFPERRRAQRIRYRAAHREELLIRDARYRVEHSEQIRMYQAQYRATHREELRTRKAEYHIANRERICNYVRYYVMTHQEQVRASRIRRRDAINAKTMRRRARKLNAPVVERVNRQDIIKRDRGICHICKKRVAPKDMSLDHLVPLVHGGEHTARNLAVAHKVCNSKRGAGRLPAQLRLFGAA